MKITRRRLRRIIKEELLEARVDSGALEMPWMRNLGGQIVNWVWEFVEDGYIQGPVNDPSRGTMLDPENKDRLYQVLESIMHEYNLVGVPGTRGFRSGLEMPWMKNLANMIVDEIWEIDDGGTPLDMEDPKNKEGLYQVLESIMHEYGLG